jgi:colicin import membrane protein
LKSTASVPAASSLHPPRADGLGLGLTLAVLVHLGLLAMLTLGVQWRSQAPATVEAELWDGVPQIAGTPATNPLVEATPAPQESSAQTPPTPAPEPEPAPAPDPVPEPARPPQPAPKPAPKPVPTAKPDPKPAAAERERQEAQIALERAKRAERERQEQAAQEAAARDAQRRKEAAAAAARQTEKKHQAEQERLAQEKQAAERQAREQDKLRKEKAAAQAKREQAEEALHAQAEQKRREKQAQLKREQAEQERREKEEAERSEKLRQEQMQRLATQLGGPARRGTGSAGAAGTAANNPGAETRDATLSAAYQGRIRARIKPNIVLTEAVPGNPLTEVEVRAASDGTIVSRRIVKASGNPEWDEAVLRAIDRTSVLPRDVDGTMPSPITISFRPRD